MFCALHLFLVFTAMIETALCPFVMIFNSGSCINFISKQISVPFPN